MGGERTGPGKHLLLHPAGLLAGWLGCLLLLLGGGCALLRVRPAGEAWQARVERLLRQGRYQEALRSLQLAYGRFPQERDRLLFEMSAIHVHPGNPRRSYGQALRCLRRLIEGFPRSPLRPQARAWASVLEQAMASQRRAEREARRVRALERSVRSLKRQVKELRARMERLKEVDLNIERRRKSLP